MANPYARPWSEAKPRADVLAGTVLTRLRGEVTAAVSADVEREVWTGHPTALRLATLVAIADRLADDIDAEVLRAREQGGTWQNIGDALGKDASNAARRYSRIGSTGRRVTPRPPHLPGI